VIATLNLPAELAGHDFTGRVVLVTGNERGIGAEITRHFHALGAAVAITWFPANGPAAAEALAAELEARGPGRTFLTPLDVRSIESIGACVAGTNERFGGLDILVNNAGVNKPQPSLEVTEAAWDDILDTGLKGAFFMSQAAARVMVARGGSSPESARYVIVNMSSQQGLVGLPRRAAYGSAKAGLVNLTRVLAIEWAQHGIRVNAVAPTVIRTDLTRALLETPEFQAEVRGGSPMGVVGEPADVANAVVFLASREARIITGHTLAVDGGWTAW
jgi:NAD(P)-dependent dehydrogenase (short-subunit alcohol dehydrogenase family)